MEKQLFDCDEETGGWAQASTLVFQFYKCTLKQDIGDFKAGTVIDTIVMDYGEGKMEFHSDEDISDEDNSVLGEFDLELKVK